MVRQVRPARAIPTPGWKAVLAVAVAGAALLWHILACTESPMAFSPSGKDLAFVTMTPYDGDDLHLTGKHTYRLAVLSQPGRVKIIEETDRHMLSAPAYSPDGKYLACLRVPLLSPEAAEKLAKLAEQRCKLLKDAPAAPEGFPRRKDDAPQGETKDLALPPLEKAAEFHSNVLAGPTLPVELVVRDAMATDIVVASVTLDLPVLDYVAKEPGQGLLFLYLLTRPQYAPDGQWIYFCAGKVVLGVNPRTGERKLLAAPATLAALSPDGRTLAAAHDKTIAFVATDGQRTTALRWEKDLSASGVVWADKDTLALLTSGKEGKPAELKLLRTDGTVARTTALPKSPPDGGTDTGELALSPDGRHVVVSYGRQVQFLDARGKVLGTWSGEKFRLQQPTFSPDSKRVAFKRIFEGPEGKDAAVEIAFFSPEGKELSAVKLPLPKFPQTGPAATGPAKKTGANE